MISARSSVEEELMVHETVACALDDPGDSVDPFLG
jgi:hypothetical protein